MRLTTTLAALALSALTALGCERRTPEAAAPPVASAPAEDGVILRGYKVPPGHGTRLRSILGTVMRHGDKTIGRVAFAPDGQLVVVGPAGIHEGVAALVKDIGNSKAPPVSPTVEMTYWLVVGHKGSRAASAKLNDPDGKCGASGVACLGDARLAKALGPVIEHHGGEGKIYLTLHEKLGMKSIESDEGQVKGPRARIRQIAAVRGDRLVVRLEAHAEGLGGGAQFDTRLQFKPDQTVVLGEAGFRQWSKDAKDDQDPKAGNSDTVLFLVVRGAIHT